MAVELLDGVEGVRKAVDLRSPRGCDRVVAALECELTIAADLTLA